LTPHAVFLQRLQQKTSVHACRQRLSASGARQSRVNSVQQLEISQDW
jgi:hypothetical protein